MSQRNVPGTTRKYVSRRYKIYTVLECAWATLPHEAKNRLSEVRYIITNVAIPCDPNCTLTTYAKCRQAAGLVQHDFSNDRNLFRHRVIRRFRPERNYCSHDVNWKKLELGKAKTKPTSNIKPQICKTTQVTCLCTDLLRSLLVTSFCFSMMWKDVGVYLQ